MSNTERKVETRWHSPPMNSGSTVVSTTSTFPCAGESTRFAPGGTRGVGSRKKYNVKTENNSQRTISAGIAIVKRMVLIKEPKKITAQITKPAISERKINLKAALVAFPECFMCPQSKA